MVLRGQGDSPVRICDPCKKLEEEARFELRHGRNSRNTKGNVKSGASEEDEMLAQLIGGQKQPRQASTNLLATSASSSSSRDPFSNEENEIIRSLSTDNVPGNVTPDELRQKAVEEKKMHRILKSQGKPDEALQAFKRGRELERQADSLEAALRKNRRLASGKVLQNAEKLTTTKKESRTDDLTSELIDLGWTDTDLQTDPNPKILSVEGELSQIIGEIGKKASSDGKKKKGIDNSQVIAMKKRALLLKKEGKLTEAKEELKKAKIWEKELEERAILGDSDESDDELAELIRGLDGRGKSKDDFDLDLDINTPTELPQLDIEKLLSGDPDHFADFEVTNEDLLDPDLNSALKSFGWDEGEEEEDNVVVRTGADSVVSNPGKDRLAYESVKNQVIALKKEAVQEKRAGNTSEAMALLKKAKLLEKDLLEVVGSQQNSSDIIKEKDPEPNVAVNTNPSGVRSSSRSKLVIQRELLAVKKHALALRREGKIEESDRELERGKLLEKELEEADNKSNLPANNMNRVMVNNTNPLELDDEIVETEVTESDMRDPGLLSVLQNLGWDEEDAGLGPSGTFVKQPVRRNKLTVQRELLAVKKRALALRREGRIEESQRELESAKLLERELDELNTTVSDESKASQESSTVPVRSSTNPLKSLEEEPVRTQVIFTEADTQDPRILSRLRNSGRNEDYSADTAPSHVLLQERASRKEIGNFSNKPETYSELTDKEKPAEEIGNFSKKPETYSELTDKEKPARSMGAYINEGDVVAASSSVVPQRYVKKSKGEIQRELLVLKRKALQLRRQGKEEEAESELEKTKELEKQLAELESHSAPEMEKQVMSEELVESTVGATRVSQTELVSNKDLSVSDRSNGVKNEILMHKRKALALKREGKLIEAKEELRRAKILEKNVDEAGHTTTDSNAVTVSEAVVPEVKPVQNRKPGSSRDRFRIQQESLSHKRNALKLRREGKIAESEAELEIAKSLEAQLDELTGEDASSSSGDVAVEDFLDPQLMSALKSIGWGEADIGTAKQESSSKRVAVERETRPGVERDDERSKMEAEIKREKIKALNLKRAGKEREALEVLRNAKLMEKKLDVIK